jgi:hypothetical protein
MDDREMVIRTGSLTKRSGRVLALDGMSVDAFPALLASFSARRGFGACAASSATRRSTRFQTSDLRPDHDSNAGPTA